MAPDADWGKIILIVGGLYISWLVLKSWGIVGSTSVPARLSGNNNNSIINTSNNWKPLTDEQIKIIKQITT